MAFFSLVYAAQKIRRGKKKATGNATQGPYSTLHFACGNSQKQPQLQGTCPHSWLQSNTAGEYLISAIKIGCILFSDQLLASPCNQMDVQTRSLRWLPYLGWHTCCESSAWVHELCAHIASPCP